MGRPPWRYRVRIWRPSATAGTQDPDLGTWTGPAGGVHEVHEGAALVQDAGESHPRDASGMPDLKSDATVILKDRCAVLKVRPDDLIEVTYPGGTTTADGQILFAREIDNAVLVRYL